MLPTAIAEDVDISDTDSCCFHNVGSLKATASVAVESGVIDKIEVGEERPGFRRTETFLWLY